MAENLEISIKSVFVNRPQQGYLGGMAKVDISGSVVDLVALTVEVMATQQLLSKIILSSACVYVSGLDDRAFAQFVEHLYTARQNFRKP